MRQSTAAGGVLPDSLWTGRDDAVVRGLKPLRRLNSTSGKSAYGPRADSQRRPRSCTRLALDVHDARRCDSSSIDEYFLLCVCFHASHSCAVGAAAVFETIETRASMMK